jgi:hypothetical protein
LLCKHFEKIPTGRHGVGRGYGLREGNKARGRIIQHINAAHPRECAAVAADFERFRDMQPAARITVLRRELVAAQASG